MSNQRWKVWAAARRIIRSLVSAEGLASAAAVGGDPTPLLALDVYRPARRWRSKTAVRAATNEQTSRQLIGGTMGLSWQQGPLGRDPNGVFVTATPMPERVLYIEPLRRRMSVSLGGSIIARSDETMILFEPARYPVAYFPIADIDESVMEPADHESTHPDLGRTTWFDVGGGGQIAKRGAWQHVNPPAQAVALRDTVAFAWRAMDAFYEEDERILGHAADPYHRIDIRRTSRHLVVLDGDQVVADTHAPLVLYESGFAPRWYVPRADVVADGLELVEGQTFCPYKGLASYYHVGDARTAAWSYRAPFEEVERITDLVSFYPEKVTITIDGEKLEAEPGQTVLAHGPDRNLSVDEIGGIELAENAAVAAAQA
jgi:uncharacterized protein (DUF427 family)